MGCRNGLGNIINDGDMCPAFSAHILLYGFAYEQRYVFCLQIQILQDVVINSLYTVRPVGIAMNLGLTPVRSMSASSVCNSEKNLHNP